MLREEGIVRIYDIFFDYDVLLSTDAFFRKIIQGPEFQRAMSTADQTNVFAIVLAGISSREAFLIAQRLRQAARKGAQVSLMQSVASSFLRGAFFWLPPAWQLLVENGIANVFPSVSVARRLSQLLGQPHRDDRARSEPRRPMQCVRLHLVGGQAVINLAAVLGLAPLTGIPLPFISYGGSSLVVALLGVGILLNIAGRNGAAAKRALPDRGRGDGRTRRAVAGSRGGAGAARRTGDVRRVAGSRRGAARS